MSPLDVALAQQGDRDAQARVFAELTPTARFMALHHARHEVDDAQQTALLSIFDALDHYDARKGSFRPFAKLYMRRDLIQKHRKHSPPISDREVVDEAPLADEALNEVMTARTVRLALRKLKNRDLELVHGVMDGKSLADIGREQNVSRQAVHIRWQRVSVHVKRALVRRGVAA